ncbi:MAG: DHA2 family efflux MFS transporter permease subunit [Patulibacter sp.]
MSSTSSAAPSPGLPAESKRLIALLVVSSFIVILNETIMSVALPELMEDLAITATTAQWLTTGFLLTMAIVIPVSGFVLQRFQVKQIFITAMAAFSVGTLIAALAPGFEVLLAGRIVQATGTALMIPLLMTTVMTLVPLQQRGQVMGLIGIVIAVAPAIGPTISGVILDALDWRWMFWIVLPIALGGLATGFAWVRNVTSPQGAHLDVFSVVVSALGFGGIVYGLSSIGEASHGPTAVSPAIPIAIGVVSLAVFVWRQLQLGDRALLDLRVFASPQFRIAALMFVATMMMLLGALIILPMFMQRVLGFSTLTTGLLLLPGGLVMGMLGPVVGGAFDRFGPRPLVVPAAAVVLVAMVLLSMLDEGTSKGFIVFAHVVLSIGLGLMFTPLLATALGSVPPERYSHGSAIVNTVQQVAGAAGTAIFITVMTRSAQSSAGGDGAAAEAGAALADGVHTAMLTGVGIAVIALIVALFVRRPDAPVAVETVVVPDASSEEATTERITESV